jgi:hypothetical protein
LGTATDADERPVSAAAFWLAADAQAVFAA